MIIVLVMATGNELSPALTRVHQTVSMLVVLLLTQSRTLVRPRSFQLTYTEASAEVYEFTIIHAYTCMTSIFKE